MAVKWWLQKKREKQAEKQALKVRRREAQQQSDNGEGMGMLSDNCFSLVLPLVVDCQ